MGENLHVHFVLYFRQIYVMKNYIDAECALIRKKRIIHRLTTCWLSYVSYFQENYLDYQFLRIMWLLCLLPSILSLCFIIELYRLLSLFHDQPIASRLNVRLKSAYPLKIIRNFITNLLFPLVNCGLGDIDKPKTKKEEFQIVQIKEHLIIPSHTLKVKL